MPDVISDTNGKLCVGSYHMWRLLSNPDNYSLLCWTSVLAAVGMTRVHQQQNMQFSPVDHVSTGPKFSFEFREHIKHSRIQRSSHFPS